MVETWAKGRWRDARAEKVTDGVFTFVALGEDRAPRPLPEGGAGSKKPDGSPEPAHSLRVLVETWAKGKWRDARAEKVTEGVFTFVALGEDRAPRPLPEGGAGG